MQEPNKQSITNILCYIVLAGALVSIILWQASKRDLANSVVYDGCYEQYASNEMPAEAFISFMQDCMR